MVAVCFDSNRVGSNRNPCARSLKRQADTTLNWPVFMDPLSWAAGVLDSAGVFTLRERDGTPYAATVRMYNRAVAASLRDVVGGRIEKHGTWYCPAHEQEALLDKLIPYMRTNIDAASAIYRFRLLSPKRAIGWTVTPAIKSFRRRLTSPTGTDTVSKSGADRPEGG